LSDPIGNRVKISVSDMLSKSGRSNDMTVVEACRAVGMPRSSFYYILENNPEAVAEVQDKAKIINGA